MSDVEDVSAEAGQAVPEPLERLARHYGVQGEYVDVWGRRRVVSADTRRGVLDAMGVACGDDAAVRRSLEQALGEERRRLLEPVRVVEESTAPWVPVRLPEDAGDVLLRWQLSEERGGVHQGEVAAADLAPDETPGVHRLELDVPVPTGYHQLRVEIDGRGSDMSLIVTPAQCYVPEALAGGERWWGLAAQLYGARRSHDWGIGDFSSLPPLVDVCARHGGALVGLSPLHAMFPAWPEHCSPYSPSSRLFLNVLYVDLERAADVTASAAARARMTADDTRDRLEALRAAPLVDYRGVAEVKLPILELAFEDFAADAGSMRYRQFQRFCEHEGDPLLRHAVFEALQEHFCGLDPAAGGWPEWPRPYQDPASAAISRFCDTHARRIDFYRWLQWLADEQLGAAARHADDRELDVGLYLDLAVSVDKCGAETWCNRHVYALDASVGAPPDAVSVKGQNWGLPPLNPRALRESGYALFTETLRRNMRHAGALRIDHVMGLMRLYWIPAGCGADAGAYVSYPLDDLLGLVALESQRNRCMVIGEDLGTVPEGLFERLQELRVLSYRLLWFEQTSPGTFRAPEDYARQALVAASTHDLPTVAGWWQDRDLRWRAMLDLYPDAETRQELERQRTAEREGLGRTLADHGCDPGTPDVPPVLAVHRFLASTPSMLLLVQAEDALGVVEQANLPATVDEHPNWRRRLPVAVESLEQQSLFAAVVSAVAEERRGATPPATAPLLPRATYRLQLNAAFTFDQARELVPYLAELGISHAYASPYLQSRPGSTHGYDITDHSAIDGEIGSRQALADWVGALKAHGMSHVVDIVPNHMGVMGGDNGWWLDVLEHGEAARHSRYFDIDWQSPERALAGKVLLPVLGSSYGEALEAGDLVLDYDVADGRFVVRYYEHVFPIDPREYPLVLNVDVEARDDVAPVSLGESVAQELASIAAALARLPRRSETSARAVEERYRDAELLRERLLRLYREVPAVAQHLEARVRAHNGGRALHDLMERQAWRLAHWRNASDEINYRRFFDINDLAGLRVEDPAVFEAVHARILKLVEQGAVGGLRVDHPDGLYDPGGYFRRLRERCAELSGPDAPPMYLLVEKILAVDEALPEDWAVSGTTGYDFGATVNGLFVDPAGEKPLTEIYQAFVGAPLDVADMAYHAKHLVMGRMLAGELQVLGNRLNRIAEGDFHTRDFTRNSLVQALREIVACFPVYRTYVRGPVESAQDRAQIEAAIAEARRRNTVVDDAVFDFVGDVLLQRSASAARRKAMQDFTMKLQQFTAPVTAKGVEDTLFYRYVRLVSLNEVGDEPARFGVPVESFHERNARRLARWPDSMLATSSHDSKRGEDLRTRLDVLSELPEEWRRHVDAWRDMNAPLVATVGGRAAPSANDQYLLYQTLAGCWPLTRRGNAAGGGFRRRIREYMLKAIREAKVHTSWVAPVEDYEQAVADFADALLDESRSAAFLDDLDEFVERVKIPGLVNSLAQTVLKLTAPGVPDIYQGSELWNFSLVDPDNRRPVDYRQRRRLLARLDGAGPAQILDEITSGLPKLHVVRTILALRARLPKLFARGDYVPLPAGGRLAGHLCAFARRDADACVVVVVPRLVAGLCGPGGALPLGEAWRGTEVEWPGVRPRGPWFVDALTGARHDSRHRMAVEQVLAAFPVAVLAEGEAFLGESET